MLELLCVRSKIALIAIVLVAFILRFYQLGNIPPSLTWDEVAWGYNAYSLGFDGKDEYERFLPLDYLESFGDFKPPVYAYLDIIPVKLFGLTEFAVRFPSAFFGVLTVFITYYLVKEIFSTYKSRYNRERRFPEYIALFSSFFLAISPWHINLSRAAFEANVATFFIVCGVLFFLKSVNQKMRFLPLSVVMFFLSAYTFNTARIVAPALLIILSIVFIKKMISHKKQLTTSVIVGLILIIPLVNFLLFPQASLRFREVNIFSDIGIIRKTNQQMVNDGNTWWTNIIHNRRLAYTAEYFKHYFDHFKPGFLFIRGDGNPKFSTQDVGTLYLWSMPFFIIGILFLIRQKRGYWWIVPIWLLIGIAPAATARETPHVLRIEATIPMFQILVAYGVYQVLFGMKNLVHSKNKRNILYVIIFLLLFVNVSYYLHGYYVHYSREYSGEWQYGYKEAIVYTKSQEDNYDEIRFTRHLGRPYIYYLFHTKTPPEYFRNNSTVERDAFGFVNVKRVGKYFYEKDLNAKKNTDKKILYIDVPGNVPDDAKKLKTFYLLNGGESLVAFTM